MPCHMLVDRRAACQADEIEIEQLGEPDPAPAGEGMARGNGQHQPVRAKGMALEARHERGFGGDADIGVARGDGGSNCRAFAILEIEVDAWIGRQELRQ